MWSHHIFIVVSGHNYGCIAPSIWRCTFVMRKRLEIIPIARLCSIHFVRKNTAIVIIFANCGPKWFPGNFTIIVVMIALLRRAGVYKILQLSYHEYLYCRNHMYLNASIIVALWYWYSYECVRVLRCVSSIYMLFAYYEYNWGIYMRFLLYTNIYISRRIRQKHIVYKHIVSPVPLI